MLPLTLEQTMKYQPKSNGMLVEEPFWDDVPVIQRQDEFHSDDFQTEDHQPPSDEPPAEEVPPVPSLESKIAQVEEETVEAVSPAVSKSQDERSDDAPPPIVLLDQHPEPSAEGPVSDPEPRLTLVEATEEEVLVESIQPAGSSVRATPLCSAAEDHAGRGDATSPGRPGPGSQEC